MYIYSKTDCVNQGGDYVFCVEWLIQLLNTFDIWSPLEISMLIHLKPRCLIHMVIQHIVLQHIPI